MVFTLALETTGGPPRVSGQWPGLSCQSADLNQSHPPFHMGPNWTWGANVITLIFRTMTDWARFKTATELTEWWQSIDEDEDIYDEIKEDPKGLKKWIQLGFLRDEPAFYLPKDLTSRQWPGWDGESKDVGWPEHPCEALYTFVEEVFKEFTGLDVVAGHETLKDIVDLDEDNRIIGSTGTWFLASNITNWLWELEEEGDLLALLFTLEDDSDANDT